MDKVMLLAEDTRQDELLILRALARLETPHRVEVVRDGQQVLDYLWREGEFSARAPGMPALLLLDLSLPRVGGLDVIARLRADARTRLLPVCVFTSSDDARDLVRSYEHGANSFVRKPLDFAALSQTVVRIGDYWLGTSEAASCGDLAHHG